MKKLISFILTILVVTTIFTACVNQPTQQTTATVAPTPAKKYSIGFVNLGPGAVLQAYVDEYQKAMTNAGWDATNTDGNFDPTTQTAQIENYIAEKVDVLVVFPVSGDAISSTVDKAMAAGIKVISFVNPTQHYDVLMDANDKVTAAYTCEMAAKWVDENFPNAANGSVKAYVLTYAANQTNVDQSTPLLQIEQYSSKIKLEGQYQLPDEAVATGVTVAENVYTTNPDINLFLTAQPQVALGISNYFTSLNSPIKDYSNIGIFTINGSDEVYNAIKVSADNKSPFRGTIVPSGPVSTAKTILELAEGLVADKYQPQSIIFPKLDVVDAHTAAEEISNGTVTSYTTSDLDKLFPNITFTQPPKVSNPIITLDNK
ncbi:MAG: substrate-binding domain-containing protein [Anaerolineales bacterium]